MSTSTRAGIRASLDRIEAILRQHPDGLRRSEIRAALIAKHDEDVPGRTLRRRLEELEDAGRARREGKSRATRYFATSTSGAPPPDGTGAADGVVSGDMHEGGGADAPIPLSPEALEVRRLVRRPRQQRTPCTYHRKFLEAYEPGESWYLREELRDELMKTGSVPDPERPVGTFARDILDRLLIDLSWSSSRLEGNTYSRLDTQNLLEHGIRAEGKSQREAQMILNHRAAIRLLVDNAEETGIDRRTVLTVHASLAENLVADPGEEGALRQRPVDVGGTVYTPTGVPQIVRECFDLLLVKARSIPDPFEQAFFLMVHIPYLQPFIDVNKRTSRLAANIPFIKANLCPLSFVDVPHETYVEGILGIYEERDVALLRDLFVWAYRRSCDQYRVVREALGEPDAIRFRYRAQLADLVRDTVRARAPIERGRLRVWAREHGIEREDEESFVERAMDILLNLTEGAAARYGLSDEALQAWHASVRAGD